MGEGVAMVANSNFGTLISDFLTFELDSSFEPIVQYFAQTLDFETLNSRAPKFELNSNFELGV